MRDVFLSGNQIKTGSDISLPVIIKMCQYNNNESLLKKLLNLKKDKYVSFGSFGNQKFDFSIDCVHRPLDPMRDPKSDELLKESENMTWINNVCHNSMSPTFRRADLEKRFIILQIPDYGYQSMSAFYRDFVPQVYINGYKVWQKYIGMIRQYSQRLAYILIDKDNNLKKSTIELKKSETKNGDDIVVRICFKNNIEQNYKSSNNITVTKKKISDNNYINYIFNDNDQNFLFTNQDRMNDNYELFVKEDENTETLIPIASSSYFFEFEVTNNDNKPEIAQQTEQDYFRQSFINDYIDPNKNENNSKVYDRPDAKRNVVIKVRFEDPNKAPKFLILKSAENSYNAVYGKDALKYIKHNTLRDFSCFNRNGSKIIPNINGEILNYRYYSKTRDSKINENKTYYIFSDDTNDYTEVELVDIENLENYYELTDELEIVPEHTNTRKYEWKTSSKISASISDILYTSYIYPWNVRNNTVLIYDSNGKLSQCGNITSEIAANSDLIIYDDGDLDSTLEAPDTTILDNIASGLSDLDSITKSELNTAYETATDPYLLADERIIEGIEGNVTSVFPYNRDDQSLRIDDNEPYFSKKSGYIEFNRKDNQINKNLITSLSKLDDNVEYREYKETYKQNEDSNIISNLKNLQKNLLKYLSRISLSNEASKKHTVSNLTNDDILVLKSNNNISNNDWYAFCINSDEPYYFSYVIPDDSGSKEKIIFVKLYNNEINVINIITSFKCTVFKLGGTNETNDKQPSASE